MQGQMPEYAEEIELAGYSVKIEVFVGYDNFTGKDFHQIKYTFPEETRNSLESFQQNESELAEFYGVCPFLHKERGRTQMLVHVPIGEHNHETPLAETQRVADGLADTVENYLS